MSAPVPAQPQPQELAASMVANPVSAVSVAQVWASQAAYLSGRALPSVCSFTPHAVTPTASTLAVPVQWWPSPGCRLARLYASMHGTRYANVIGRIVTFHAPVLVTLVEPTGSTVVRDGATGFDGMDELHPNDPLSAARMLAVCGISTGAPGTMTDTVHDLFLQVAPATLEGLHEGIAELALVEVPVARLYPELGEPGLNTQAFDPRNEIVATSAIAHGTADVLTAEQDTLRVRWHWQIGTYEHTSYAWTRSSTTIGPLDWVGTVGTAVDPAFRVRVPAVYGASTNATFTMRVRFYSTDDVNVRVIRSVVGAGTSNFDDTLPATGGVWSAGELLLPLSTAGTDQEVDLQFNFATVDGSPVFVSSIAIIQNESV
jgi:hypothetical protein